MVDLGFDQLSADDLIASLMAEPVGDPYPLYEILRVKAPNHLSSLGLRFISSYAECVEVLRSPDFSQSFGLAGDDQQTQSAFYKMVKDMLILSNPPEHTRLRRLLLAAFSPGMVECLRPQLEALVGLLLDKLEVSAHPDIMNEFAAVIPSMTLWELIGAPYDDFPKGVVWGQAIQDALVPIINDDILQRADEAAVAYHEYIRGLIVERRKSPGDDLISALVAVESEGDRLSESELVNLLFTLLAAGSDTTTAAIGMGTRLLCLHPSERQKLQTHPHLMQSAIDEILRFDAPIQNAFLRVAERDTRVGDQVVVKGEMIAMLIGSANRDPSVFTEPNQFLIDRPDGGRHIAFGSGLHNCLGRHLARLQIEIALSTLWDRFPNLALESDETTWTSTIPSRKLDHLYVRLAGPSNFDLAGTS